MRVMFASWGWTTHYLPMVPLAWAFRSSGHEVLVATQPSLVRTVCGSGLPAVAVGDEFETAALEGRFLRKASPVDRPPMEWEELRRFGPRNCGLYVAVAGLMLDDLLAAAGAWRPDLIVFEPSCYAAPIVGAALGIPAVRHTWGVDYTYLGREFEPEALAPVLDRLGLPEVETLGAVSVDPCPPSLQVAPTPRVTAEVERLPMRYVPYNNRGVQPSWVTRRPDRPRVLVIWGMSSALWDPRLDLGGWATRALAGLDAEVVLLTAGEPDPELAALPNVRAARQVGLNVVAPTCDLVVSHGGLGTLLTAAGCGVPQFILPQVADRVLNARQLAATGAGDFAFATQCDEEELRRRVGAMLADASFGAAASVLRDEMAALDDPARVVCELVARFGG
jgi:UDP:flavonoid glycosyltransferase YjiC (YdhE family)